MNSAPASLSFDLEQANTQLRLWLDDLNLDRSGGAPVSPKQMAGLLSELMRAGRWLRSRPAEKQKGESDSRVSQYRENLERIRDLLPTIHRQLLAERSRLEAERARMESAASWAQSSRQTL